MKRLLLIIIFLSSINIYSQSSLDQQIEKVQSIFKEHSLIKNDKEIFYNKSKNVLDFGKYTAPLNFVEIEYDYDKEKNKHHVELKCFDKKPCFNDRTFELYIPFKTKKNCYDFINALAELNKMSLENY